MRLPLCFLAFTALAARADIVFTEIHYHPVEEPTFNTDGTPVYDLSNDIHEFVEIQNTGASAVDLSGYVISGGIDFSFPAGTTIASGAFKVIAKTPARIETVYALTSGSVLGAYTGSLSNNSDTIRIKNAAGDVLDSVTYDSKFPWAQSADAMGAADRFTGLTSSSYNFKGRSLQRVSTSWASGDPANWLASSLTGPTPGSAQSVTRTVPKPVVTAQNYAQTSDGSILVRASQAVTVNCTFSATSSLSSVTLEYFLDDVNSTTETKSTVTMTDLGSGKYTASIPGQVDKSIVRYRFKANRGDGLEVVSPRSDDPQIAPVGTSGALEAWFGYYVTPVRTTTNAAIYDLLIGTTPLTQMNTNITQTSKRTTAGSATGIPRDKEILLAKGQTVTATTPLWNGSQPAVFACNGILYDVHIRYHGSRYHRAATNHSFKLHFLEHQKFNERDSWFVTGHAQEFIEATKMNRLLGLPASNMRAVSWYFNTSAVETRYEQGEYDNDMLDTWSELQQQLNPGSTKEARGDLYKTVGNRDASQNNLEGPYTKGDEAPLAANAGWTQLERYSWTHSLQSNSWKGAKPIRDLFEGMWTVRGDTPTTQTLASNATNLANTKAWFNANFDMETTLTSMALLMWMSTWDDQAHNQFWWKRANGKWVRLGWDYDQVMTSSRASQSPYSGEVGVNVFDGVNWWKDTFFKCFRSEFNQRLWELNNSFCDPVNLTANGLTTATTFANAGRTTYLNGLFSATYGTYNKPVRPTNASPATGSTIVSATNLTTSTYSSPNSSAHASTRWEIRSSTGNYEEPVYRVTSTTAKTSLAIPFDQLTYGQTYYWRVTYYDAAAHPSNVSAETSFTWGTTSATAGTIVINEVLAFNRNAYANSNDYPDCIEIRNNGTTTMDISGYTLTDDPLTPAKYTLPSGSTITAGGYLIVFADSATTSPGLHTSFGLDSDGDQILLLNGATIVDSVTFGPQAPDVSIGRITNGTGGWQACTPTIGLTNSAKTLGSIANLKINEYMANPAYGEDWFEVYNSDSNVVALAGLYLSDTPSTPAITQLPALSFIAGKGFQKFWADGTTSGNNHCNFKLSNSGESLVLTQSNASTTIDTVTFSTQTKDVAQGRMPDGGSTMVSFTSTASPQNTNWATNSIVINEVLANAASPFEDAIELYNTSASSVSVGGWWLSDDLNVRQKYQIPAGTTIAAGGYLVIYESQMLAGTVPFSLNARGDEVILSAVDGSSAVTGYGSLVRFGAADEDVSFGRVTATGLNASAGGAEFWRQSAKTFGVSSPASVSAFRAGTGASNAGPAIGPITINEVMYHPPDVSAADYTVTEFLELSNTTASAIDLSGYRLKGDTEFTFPSGASLPANGYIVVVSFNPDTDTTSLSTFRTAYSLSAGSPVIFGPYSEKLSNSTMSVEIAKPATISGVSTFVNLDKVEYRDSSPWVTTPDGGGKSLQRASSSVIANTASNWTGSNATPEAINVGVVASLAISSTSPLTGGVVSTSYSGTLTAINGTAPYTWSLTSGSVPGLTLSTGGELIGTPTTEGTYTLNVLVTDGASATASKSLTITIATSAQNITSTSPLTGGAVNAAYSATLAATGGTTPYTWSIVSGSLPTGLALSSGGVLSGTPTVAGVFTFTAQVNDNGGLSTMKSFTLTIAASPLVITNPATLTSGLYGASYSQALTATGGTTPYVWTISSGSLPGGLSLDSAGDITGTPTAVGTFNFTAQVTDNANTITEKVLELTIAPPALSIASSTLPLAIIGEAYSQTLSAAGGVPPYAWSGSALPAGLSLSSGGVLSGSATTTSSVSVTFQVTDSTSTSATRVITLSSAATGPFDHYTWDYVPTTAYSTVPFAVKVTARDSGERAINTTGGSVSLTATSGNATTSPVLITEVIDGDEDQIELQNVTSSSASTSGWTLILSDSDTDINSQNAITYPLPASLASGATLRLSELNSTAEGRSYFGGAINWSTSGKLWVLLVDDSFTIRDAFIAGWTTTDLGTFSVDLDGEGTPVGSEWTTNGLAAGTRAPSGSNDSFQRIGTRDHNTASDWQWRHNNDNSDATSPGVANTGLTLPWAPTITLGVTPASATLTTGAFTGYLTLASSGTDAMLRATDTSSITGTSALFTVLAGTSTASDGLPDSWKVSNSITSATADDDGDGVSNYNEFLAGTDPHNASSLMKIAEAAMNATGTQFSLSFTGIAGKWYRVSTSDDLSSWTALQPAILATTTGAQTVSVTLSGDLRKFFRVEIVP